jgi:hypothetical protein
MKNLKRCYQCFKAPKVTIEDNGTKFNIILECETPGHGHMAMGDSLETAENNWNTYLELSEKMTKKAA